MKAERKAGSKGGDSVTVWIAVSGGITALLLVGVLVLKARSSAMERRLGESMAQYEKMKEMKKRIRDLSSRGAAAPKGDENPEGFAAYLSSAAGQAGLPSAAMSISPGGKRKVGAWLEWPVEITLSGSKDSPVPRSNLVDYLSRVEREKPYLKSKNLTLSFADGDFQRVTVTFSYFRRE